MGSYTRFVLIWPRDASNKTKFAGYCEAINDPNTPFFQPDEDILYYNDCYVKDKMKIIFNELNVELSMEEITKAIKQKAGKHVVRI